MIKALITQRNNPKVNIVAGRVKKTNMGLTNAFNKANTMATPKAPQNPFTSTPGKMYDNPMTISAVKIKLKIVLIISNTKCVSFQLDEAKNLSLGRQILEDFSF